MDAFRACFNALREVLSGQPAPEPYAKFIAIVSSPPFIDEEDKSWWPENNKDGVEDHEYLQINKNLTHDDVYDHAEELLDALLTALDKSDNDQSNHDDQDKALALKNFNDSVSDLIYELETYLYDSFEEEEEEEDAYE